MYNIGDWIINQLVTSGAILYNNNNEFDNLVGNYDNWGQHHMSLHQFVGWLGASRNTFHQHCKEVSFQPTIHFVCLEPCCF